MLKSGNGLLKVVAVRVGGTRVLVLADGFAYGRLGEGGREGDGLNDGAGAGVVRTAGVNGKSAEVVNWRGCPGRGLDGMIGHGDGHFGCR